MRQTFFKVALTTAIAGVALVVAVAGHASAQGNIGGRVTNPDPKNPRSNSIFIYKLKHGQTKSDQLTVVNGTDTKQTVTIGSVDGVASNTGAFSCRQELEPVHDSGGWVKLSTREVTLEAGARKNVDFTVTVPQKADVGEHNSCITMQTKADGDDGDKPGLNIHMRQAIRMVVTMPGELKRKLSISGFDVSVDKKGSPKYDITISNKGNVSADVNTRISLTNIFGQEVDGSGGESPVLPDQSLLQGFGSTYRPIFGGLYKAEPRIEFDTRMGIYGTQNSSDQQLETVDGDSVNIVLMPTVAGWLIIIGVISALAGGTWLFVTKTRRNRSLRSMLSEYTVKNGDTLQSLADRHDIQWRDIARINKIRAPYVLGVGDKIQLPIKQSKK